MTCKSGDFLFPPSSFKQREEETFEDYTTVTPWEKFIQSLENILSRWELKADGDAAVRQSLLKLSTGTLSGYICGRLHFGDREFLLVYYSGIESETSSEDTRIFAQTEQTFIGHVLPAAAWFGLSHVLILRPSEGTIKGGTRLHMLLSSVEMALHSVRCPIPILVEYYGPYSSYFYGLATMSSVLSKTTTSSDYDTALLGGELNVDFTIGQLRGSVNPLCTHLAGLKGMFLEKLGYPSNIQPDISARFIYPIPFWPEPEDLPSSPFPSFSFDMTPLSSAFPLFHLSTVWPKVPLHAVTQKSSWMNLRPEGAPEWYMQVFLQTSHADRLSSRLKRFCQTCRDSDVDDPEFVPKQTTLTSRLSWLGADLPRLRSLFKSQTSPPKLSPSYLRNVEPGELSLTQEHLIHYLLFLFPDADANLTSESSLAEELRQPWGDRHGHSELLSWSRIENRSTVEMADLAKRLHLPPPMSLIHRLAVLLCNLHFLQTPPHTSPLVQIVYNEVCLELQLRLDRLICLPMQYDASSEPPGAGSFVQWSMRDKCDLHAVLERFNACVKHARTCQADSSPSETSRKDDDDESFFDAVEEWSSVKADSDTSDHAASPTTTDNPIGEARTILDWLRSLKYVQFLRLLMPSICLETLLTLYSIQPHPRILPFYTESLCQLVSRLENLFNRFDNDLVQLDGYSNFEELFTATFCEALTLLARFTSRLNCFQELLSAFLFHVNFAVSDECLSLLYTLSMNAVCGLTEWTAHSTGWVPIKQDSHSFQQLRRLFGTKIEASGSATSRQSIERFRFTSSSTSWFSQVPPLDLRRPTWETYLIQSICGQPNPQASRPGPQRLYVELNNGNGRHSVLLAGAFSHDTQFF